MRDVSKEKIIWEKLRKTAAVIRENRKWREILLYNVAMETGEKRWLLESEEREGAAVASLYTLSLYRHYSEWRNMRNDRIFGYFLNNNGVLLCPKVPLGNEWNKAMGDSTRKIRSLKKQAHLV